MPIALAPLDWTIIAIYLITVLVIGVWVAKKTETGEDLFLAGRSLGWGVIGFSLFASNISSTTLIGLAGQAYASGIAISNYEWMAGVALVFMALFLIPLYLNARITTIPDFIHKRFDRRSALYFSAISVFLSIIVDTAGALYAGAVVAQTFFPGLPLLPTMVGLALFAGLYTAAGGLKAVVFTDVLQAVVLIIGTTCLTVFLFAEFDFSWTAVTATLPDGHLSLIRPADDPGMPWPGTLLGVPILGFWYWATNQYIAQRVLGARDVHHARLGALFGGALKILPLFIMVLPGVMALHILPPLDTPDAVFPTLIRDVLPTGLKGLVLAGLIAAIMSSIDSTLNSASTLIINDFVKPLRRDLSPARVGFYGRLATIGLMIIALVWAPLIQTFPSLWTYLQQVFSILVPPVAALFLVGIFWRRGNGTGAFWSLITGHALCLALFVLGEMGLWDMHFLVTTGIMTAVSMLLFVLFSLLKPAPSDAALTGTVWTPALLTPDHPHQWYEDYRILSAIILAFLGLQLVLFW